jgi:anti-sigma B factor antagonist
MHWTSIDERTSGTVTILGLRGYMTLASQEKTLLDRIKEVIGDGRLRIVLSLAHVPFVDSVGLGEIVRAYSTVIRAGGALCLCGVASRVQNVLEATQLSRVLATYPTEEEAVAKLQGTGLA